MKKKILELGFLILILVSPLVRCEENTTQLAPGSSSSGNSTNLNLTENGGTNQTNQNDTEKIETERNKENSFKEDEDDSTSLPIIFGVIFASLALLLLTQMIYVNEVRTSQTQKTLDYLMENAFEPDNQEFNARNEGKILVVSGQVETETQILDKELGIVFEDAIYVFRKVEMLLQENAASPSYEGDYKQWSQIHSNKILAIDNRLLDTGPLESKEFKNAFKINNHSLLQNSAKMLENDLLLYPIQRDTIKKQNIEEKLKFFINRVLMGNEIQIKDRSIYLGRFSNRNTLGDIKITYYYLPKQEMTVIGRQIQGLLIPFVPRDETEDVERSRASQYKQLKEEEEMERAFESGSQSLEDANLFAKRGFYSPGKKPSLLDLIFFPSYLILEMAREKKFFFKFTKGSFSKSAILYMLTEENNDASRTLKLVFFFFNLLCSYLICSYVHYLFFTKKNWIVRNFFGVSLVIAFVIMGVSFGLIGIVLASDRGYIRYPFAFGFFILTFVYYILIAA